MLGGGGVDGAIHNAAGDELVEACRPLNGCETGDAKITPGFNLPSRHVIHAVGPVYSRSKGDENAELLSSCYRRSLEVLVENKLTSIAFNCISSGIYGCALLRAVGWLLTPSDPIRDATEVALTTVRDFLLSDAGKPIELALFCIHSNRDLDVYEEMTPAVFPPTDEQVATTEAGGDNATAEAPGEVDAPAPESAADATPAADGASTPAPEKSE